jgi:phosphomevalonate kinase
MSLSSTMLIGQKAFNAEKREKMQAKKVAFITNKLNLSPEEAEKFWPIYNKENEKIHSCFNDIRTTLTEVRKSELTDKEAMEKANELIDIEAKILQHKRDLINNLKGVISGNKILLLMKSERDFRRSMMRGLDKKRKRMLKE